MLLTHPLPESRLADARNRANQMRPVVVQSSADFYLAKARTLGMYTSGDNKLGNDLLSAGKKAIFANSTPPSTAARCWPWAITITIWRAKRCSRC
jgi:predicted Zn-dependent protease